MLYLSDFTCQTKEAAVKGLLWHVFAGVAMHQAVNLDLPHGVDEHRASISLVDL